MNLSEITVDPDEAAEKAAEYARSEDRTPEDAGPATGCALSAQSQGRRGPGTSRRPGCGEH